MHHTHTQTKKALGRSGFINYFGSQRFGTYGAPTSSIGACFIFIHAH